ncbi:armadillo-type protein, partial [Gaertneriomyces semiglobifer]
LRRADLLCLLLALLDPSEVPEVQDEATFALSNLARDYATKSAIRKAGGIRALVVLLESQDPDVKKNAALALTSMLEDFASRLEVRQFNGLASLLELLASEFREIQENALTSLIRCAEDQGNRVEIRKLNGILRMIDFLNQDTSGLQHLTLLCLANCLEDPETGNIFHELGGTAALVKMADSEDVRLKRHADLALARAARNEKNQSYIREAGALPILMAHLSHADAGVISHAAMTLVNLAKNEINQLELSKAGAVEVLIQHLSHEDLDVNRQCVAALSSLFSIAAMRAEVVKLQGVHSLAMVLQKSDVKIQATSALALARCLQDEECRIAFSREPAGAGLSRLIDLLGSKDIYVCRNASYAIANAAQYDLCAKYWLQNTLSDRNFISDNFYDFGAAGPNPDPQHPFPSIEELQSLPVDKRREVLLIDTAHDGYLNALVQLAGSGPLSARTPRQQLRQIASIVSQVMGGPVDPTRLQDMAYKFKITELKMKLHSNVIPLGQITQGTFYHRALLFKFICDKLGLTPCTLVRGEYGRAWTIVDPTRQNLKVARAQTPTPAAVPAPTAPAATKPEKPTSASRNRHAQAAANSNKQDAENATASGGMAGAATATPSTSAIPATIVPVSVPQPVDDDESYLVEECIVDLMFEPGRLLPLGSPEAESYQRFT